jgi:hypothetical protein
MSSDILGIIFNNVTFKNNIVNFRGGYHSVWSRHLPDRVRKIQYPFGGGLPNFFQNVYVTWHTPIYFYLYDDSTEACHTKSRQ